MTMANLRFQVVEEAFSKKPLEVIAPLYMRNSLTLSIMVLSLTAALQMPWQKA